MITIKLTGGPKVQIGASMDSLLRVQDMQKLGNLSISTIRSRTARGLGSDGAPMTPLKASRIETVKTGPKSVSFRRIGYAAWKAKQGLQPIRDLVGTGAQGGHMWDNFSVRFVTETQVRMAFTAKHQREKAHANEMRSPFLSYAPQDQKVIVDAAREMFGVNVRSLGVTRALAIFRKRRAA